jgi:allophanate hydrolase subunit 1
MIYQEPVFRFLADSYVGVEFGDDADLRNNFRVIALVEAFRALEAPWALEVVPTLREFGVVYDRTRIGPEAVADAIAALLPEVRSAPSVTSRLFKLPVWYRDPWSEEINRKAGLKPSIEIVAEANGCTAEEVVTRHSGTDYWVTCVGWGPGCYFAYPIARALGVSGPKLQTARPYASERLLMLGGLCTAAMPFPGPSGYQMLGRLAVPIYRPQADIAGIPEHGAVFRAGDRHRYVPVGPLEYEAVREQIARGTYQYDITVEDFALADLERGGYAG